MDFRLAARTSSTLPSVVPRTSRSTIALVDVVEYDQPAAPVAVRRQHPCSDMARAKQWTTNAVNGAGRLLVPASRIRRRASVVDLEEAVNRMLPLPVADGVDHELSLAREGHRAPGGAGLSHGDA
jgi:hypothetical protein